FGMIAAVGLSNLQFVDLNSARNLFIIGFAFFMGLSLPEYFVTNPLTATPPAWLAGSALLRQSYQGLIDIANTLGQTGMAIGAFIALLLDNTIPGTSKERGIDALHSTAEKKRS
ncbi:MAG: xanthine permease, partial [bacterium]|nr:xanthine permease [bacterium]